MKNVKFILSLVTILTLYSCSSKESYTEFAADMDLEGVPAIVQKQSEKVERISERKIIKEGDISFETANVKETKSLITKILKEVDGYISKDNVYDYSDKIEHRLIIRVPADKFDLLLTRISESAEKLDSKNIDVLDVTEDFIDVESRIKTKKELENRYQEILKQASKVEEILSIEKELGLLRTEIESVEGRLRYLKDRISFSTLTVTYYEKASVAFGFNSKFGQALKNGWSYLMWFIVGLTSIWPFIIIIATGIYLAIRLDKKRKNKN